jgi:hypothetical protein
MFMVVIAFPLSQQLVDAVTEPNPLSGEVVERVGPGRCELVVASRRSGFGFAPERGDQSLSAKPAKQRIDGALDCVATWPSRKRALTETAGLGVAKGGGGKVLGCCLRVEIAEDGENPSVVAVRDRQSEFGEDVGHVFLDGPFADDEM